VKSKPIAAWMTKSMQSSSNFSKFAEDIVGAPQLKKALPSIIEELQCLDFAKFKNNL